MKLLDYAGAGSRLDPDRALALDPSRWAWQRKVDGCYVQVSTDAAGRVANVLTRAARAVAPELRGAATGIPDAVLHGELEAHTEAGERTAAARGFALVHLFDASRAAGRRVAALPYADRLAVLHQHQVGAELAGRDHPWTRDARGDHHDRAGRYARPVPRDARRFPVVETVRGAAGARELWRAHVELGGGEGLVAVRLDAPLGARAAKRKVKATDTLDARVVAIGGGAATLAWGGNLFAVSARGRWAALSVGAIVEVAADGYYEAGATPRFARIVRERSDLR